MDNLINQTLSKKLDRNLTRPSREKTALADR
jgi:hypothetical protein